LPSVLLMPTMTKNATNIATCKIIQARKVLRAAFFFFLFSSEP
jgi:hypothetical protein